MLNLVVTELTLEGIIGFLEELEGRRL